MPHSKMFRGFSSYGRNSLVFGNKEGLAQDLRSGKLAKSKKMWTYIVGPIVALLPKGWRRALPFARNIHWAHAATLSGFAELVVALAGLMKWYSVSMTTWVNRGLEVALDGKAGPGITDVAIGGMAWFLWVNHPLTWILGYFSVEGAVRMCGAAFSESLLGTLPLFVVDKAVRVFFGGSKTVQDAPGLASSFIGAVSDKIQESRVPASADEISVRKEGVDEILEIRASRKKADWDPPRVVRFEENYYRLEECGRCAGSRPFRYSLRRLSAGVPGRNVLLYEREDALVTRRR